MLWGLLLVLLKGFCLKRISNKKERQKGPEGKKGIQKEGGKVHARNQKILIAAT